MPSTPAAAAAPIQLTEEQAAAAFTLWEVRFRTNSANFLTADEMRRMDAADLGTSSAIYFMALLREVQR